MWLKEDRKGEVCEGKRRSRESQEKWVREEMVSVLHCRGNRISDGGVCKLFPVC